MPRGDNTVADRSHGTEGRMLGIEKFLAGGKELAIGRERLCRLGLLGRREGLADTEPGEGKADGGHAGPETV